MRDWAIWGFLFSIVNILFAGAVTVHAILRKRDSRAVIGWVGLAWLAPILGSCAYLFLGINRIQRRAASLRLRNIRKPISDQEPSLAEQARMDKAQAEYPNFVGLARAVEKLSGLPLTPGNRVQPLIDGDQAYPAMIEAVNHARRSVALLSYIFDSDRVGEKFVEALVEARHRGVAVRVLVDDVGSKYSRPNIVRRLTSKGITAASFLPTRIPRLPTRIPRLPTTANLRNHRKILVVDGDLGFTGGTNISEGHCLALLPKQPVQCLHFQLQGPVVEHLRQVFAMDWAFTTGEMLAGEEWCPTLRHHGPVWARGIEHGPDESFEKLVDVIASALASARKRVRIVTPYFLPRSSLIEALNVAALRGVEVEIYLPLINNIALVQWAATAQLWQILEKGCRVFYTTPPFDHTKLMLVDDVWTLLGSTNWDPRSLRLNFEFNVECYDDGLAKALNEIVDDKARSAREVTLAEIDGRGFPTQLRDGLARLLTPYL